MAYVYAILVDDVVRYIGKGSVGRKLSRFEEHMKMVRSIARRRAAGEAVRTTLFYNKLTKTWLNGAKVHEVILADGLTDEQAYAREAEEISQRVGLWNMDPGGRGRGVGYRHTFETKAKQSVAQAGQKKTLGHRAAMCVPKVISPDIQERLSDWRRERMMCLSPEERHDRAMRANQAHRGNRKARQIWQTVLDTISGAVDGASSADIREMLDMKNTVLKPILSRLRGDGLIERRGGYHDGRYYRVKPELKLVSN